MNAQLSPEWFQDKLGKVSASRIPDILARTKSGNWGASRENYMAELIAQTLTGEWIEGYKDQNMINGLELQPQARDAYAFYKNVEVSEVGFIHHPTIEGFGCSPDGLIGEDGLVEFKCPLIKTHINTLLTQKIPQDYADQMQSQMSCTKRYWDDFASYCPKLPEDLKLFIRRLKRDDERIAFIEKEVQVFIAEMKTKLRLLQGLKREDVWG